MGGLPHQLMFVCLGLTGEGGTLYYRPHRAEYFISAPPIFLFLRHDLSHLSLPRDPVIVFHTLMPRLLIHNCDQEDTARRCYFWSTKLPDFPACSFFIFVLSSYLSP